ncbi:MAG: PLP-dependent aminotransferase family protein [Candidatus Thorarchaeota archaeon]
MVPYYAQLADWTRFIPESEIRRLLKIKVKYYFAGGLPGSLPLDAFRNILREIGDDLETNGINILNYGPTTGIPSLKRTLEERLIRVDGISIPRGPEDILVSTGSQQMIYGLLDVLLRPKDVVIMARPAYLGFVVPVTKLGGDVLTVPSDSGGITPENVQKAVDTSKKVLNRTPKALYVVPDSDNPTGTTLSEKRRKQIFEICASEEILIIEDAAYREIQFEKVPPPIKYYDSENEWVVYLRTSSKEAAVLRLGYSVIPEVLMPALTKVKGYLDLCTPTLNQKILEIYYSKYIDTVLDDNLKIYKERRDIMRKTLDAHFPSTAARTDPTGGFFFWVRLEDETFNTTRFLQEVAIPNDVIYVPGQSFYPIRGYSVRATESGLYGNRVKTNGMRLSYSFSSPTAIEEGLSRLGSLLAKEIEPKAHLVHS